MLADPLYLQAANGDVSYDTVLVNGSKTIRRRTDTIDTSGGGFLSGTLTVSHDQNPKTGRVRSVLRVDTVYNDPTNGNYNQESVAAYLVIDQPVAGGKVPVTTPTNLKSAIAQILSFFATDPTAATPSSIPLAISTTNGVKFMSLEP